MDLYEAKEILESELTCRPLADKELLTAIKTVLEVIGDKEFCAVCGEQMRSENDYHCCGFERYVK